MTKIPIDKNECIGCNICADFAPEIFEVGRENFKCKLKKENDLSPEELEKVKEAIKNCPVQAITLLE